MNFELDAITAAFIGGVGKVVGAITGGLIMAVINNGMSLIGAPSERVMLVKGIVLLAAVAYDIWNQAAGDRLSHISTIFATKCRNVADKLSRKGVWSCGRAADCRDRGVNGHGGVGRP